MKITFLEPPPLDGKRIPERFAGCSYELYHFPDLANLSIFSLLKTKYDVSYIDCIMENYNWDSFKKILSDSDTDIYVIHSVILSKKTDLKTLLLISKLTKAKIFFHGPEPTRVPQEYLKDDRCVVFRGEPEFSMLNYISGNRCSGISYIKNSKIIHLPAKKEVIDLDKLPLLIKDFGPLKDYKNRYFNPKFKKKPYCVLLTSRGCTFNCLFCVPNSVSFARELEYRKYFGCKPPIAVSSAKKVIKEFKDFKKHGYKSIMVVDDQFLWSKERTLAICKGIKNLGIEWGCLSRADFLTDLKIVKALSNAGCKVIDIGVESLNQRTLDYVRKNLKVETVFKAIQNLNKVGILPKLNIMFGCSPKETVKDIKTTVERLKNMEVMVMFSIATPFRGTEFHKLCKRKGYLIDDTEDINPFEKCIISYPNLKKDELEKLQKWAYRSYYLRPKYILKRISTYQSLLNLFDDIKVAIRLIMR